MATTSPPPASSPTTVVLVPSAAPDPAPAPVLALKPGYATSEGWINFLIGTGTTAGATLATNAPMLLRIIMVIVALLTTVSHTWARTSLKKAQITANTAGSPTAKPNASAS